jgi:hypothetical protein
MFRKIHFIILALLAAAVAAPVGQATDPLAQSVLRGEGLSASQVKAWTTGVCSHQVKPASCYRSPAQTGHVSIAPATPKPVDPLAVSILRGRRWSASRIYDWTQGACSYQVKPSSCYLTAAQARSASQRLADSMGGPRSIPSAIEVRPGGFDWSDALIGAAVTAGIFVFGVTGAFVLHRRRDLAHP